MKLVIFAVALNIFAAVFLLVGGTVLMRTVITPALKRVAHPNACCPNCQTDCYIDGMETMTWNQKLAINRRCPTCGHVTEVMIFEDMMALKKNRQLRPPAEEIQDMQVP